MLYAIGVLFLITFALHGWMLRQHFINQATLNAYVDSRVKADMARWIFGSGGGGIVAAMQHCAKCAAKVAKWSMIPGEGPVCPQCLNETL